MGYIITLKDSIVVKTFPSLADLRESKDALDAADKWSQSFSNAIECDSYRLPYTTELANGITYKTSKESKEEGYIPFENIHGIAIKVD